MVEASRASVMVKWFGYLDGELKLKLPMIFGTKVNVIMFFEILT